MRRGHRRTQSDDLSNISSQPFEHRSNQLHFDSSSLSIPDLLIRSEAKIAQKVYQVETLTVQPAGSMFSFGRSGRIQQSFGMKVIVNDNPNLIAIPEG